MGYKIKGGGFKPEEATDKLTCPYVRGLKGVEQGAFQGSRGKGLSLTLLMSGLEGRSGRGR